MGNHISSLVFFACLFMAGLSYNPIFQLTFGNKFFVMYTLLSIMAIPALFQDTLDLFSKEPKDNGRKAYQNILLSFSLIGLMLSMFSIFGAVFFRDLIASHLH